MLTYKEIIDKLKDILSKEQHCNIKDKDVAVALNIDYNNFRKQKARNSPHYPEIMQFLAQRNISINWFFFNQLPETLIESTSSYIILKYQKSITGSAGGGAINQELDSIPLIIDKQLLDHINSSYKYTEIIKVFGESMEPHIKDNSLVFVDRNQTNINSTGVYVINNPDGLFIKKIRVKDNNYYMCSLNQEYKEIKLENFSIVGQVKGIFNKL